ncbi:hypothetical protein [Pseudolysinimonas sp.]|uniref:hypothetical protein n=1 Tax=Pseudolysinimonas sp. TaxID=2680009 RepID=UPI003F7FAE83
MTATAPALAPPARVGNAFGLAAFLLAAAILVVGIATRVVSYAAPVVARDAHLTITALSTVFTVSGVVGLLLGIAAAAVGIVGLTRPGRPHGLAGAGAAVGLFEVGSWIVSFAGTPIVAGLMVTR